MFLLQTPFFNQLEEVFCCQKNCRRRYPKSRVLRHSPPPCCFYSILAFNTWPGRSSLLPDGWHREDASERWAKKEVRSIVRWSFDEMPYSGYWIITQHENYLSTSHQASKGTHPSPPPLPSNRLGSLFDGYLCYPPKQVCWRFLLMFL